MNLLPFFQWCEASAIGRTLRNSHWLFPAIEAIHLLGLGVTGGAVLVLDLRLLGLGQGSRPLTELWDDVAPWLAGSVTVMFATGIPLFLSESIRCYYSFAFWVKMTCLFTVVIFTFAFQRQVTRMQVARPFLYRFTAIVSLLLWSAVGWGGRWIAFS
jgi:uncharacterized membrane protein SirB2